MDYVDAVRLRLGCGGPADAVVCGLCGAHMLDSTGVHAGCCHIAEATKAHNKLEHMMLKKIQQIDPAAESEVAGLIPGTDLRPADILTSACGIGESALDVSITSPHR